MSLRETFHIQTTTCRYLVKAGLDSNCLALNIPFEIISRIFMLYYVSEFSSVSKLSKYFISCVYCILFSYLFILFMDTCCFHILAVLNNATMNMYMPNFLWDPALRFVNVYSEIELLHYIVTIADMCCLPQSHSDWQKLKHVKQNLKTHLLL